MTLTDIPLSLEIVDTVQESLSMAEKHYKEMPANSLIKDIAFYQNIDDLYEMLDVVIIATTSKSRRLVIEQLLARKKVQYLILEKVLFPALNDYDEIQKLRRNKYSSQNYRCSCGYETHRDIFELRHKRQNLYNDADKGNKVSTDGVSRK